VLVHNVTASGHIVKCIWATRSHDFSKNHDIISRRLMSAID